MPQPDDRVFATRLQVRLWRSCARFLLLSFIAIGCSTVAHAAAESFPSRPIRLISPFAPGGGNDILSRTLALPMAKSLDQSVIVDNRPGANTIVGMEILAKAAPDGHTIAMSSSTQAINATLYPRLPYDSIRDFSPVSVVADSPLIVAVNATLPIRSIRDLIAAAAAKPGAILYPSAGTGNSTHLAGELFAVMTGVTLVHVPYKGAGPGITDLMGGRLQAIFGTALSVLPHVKSGRLRALAVTTARRSAALPDLPTVAESGVAGYEASTWYGVMAPARTPRRIVMLLNAEIVKALATPDVRDRLTGQGLDPVGNSPEQFAAYLQTEVVKWAKVIKVSGAKPE